MAPVIRIDHTTLQDSAIGSHMLACYLQTQLVDTAKRSHISTAKGKLGQEGLRNEISKFGHSDSLPRPSPYIGSHADASTPSNAKSHKTPGQNGSRERG